MTEFEEIYDLFLSQITDYEMVRMEDEDLDQELAKLLQRAVFDFIDAKNLTADFDEEVFNRTLTDLEMNIIINYMVYEWVKPRIYNIELLKQRLSQGDYVAYSQSAHLKELMTLSETTLAKCEHLCRRYDMKNYLEGGN